MAEEESGHSEAYVIDGIKKYISGAVRLVPSLLQGRPCR